MNRDEIRQAVDAQRRDVADLLEGLTDDEWRQPSLCTG
ncbi:maleylpyruvate isomerase N-terminal domain-containing protein [Dactylosporangium fulvum]|uniref:Maleylpyruvate isomerase N-terminal domain-containing protein n=1 Tax=Dactylosporangium fulvum TaxID=53359 RepID=A0ABY5WDF5_9ACTN|nr:maleylpyruvate isomerase N-terminal domain-containing protein [Dactylosporangium fulvum]UWP86336.1 maleylpyruvate isomerase N-terminal domain-containing protein [Dactylosporangium fulvum]